MERTGLSPKDYVTKIQLTEAKKLLKTTTYTIKNISLTVGFKDPLYFSRVFLKHEHCSPTEYRMENQKNSR